MLYCNRGIQPLMEDKMESVSMSRRSFNKAVLVLSVCWSTFLTGCSVMADIVSWGPVGLASFNAMVLVLENGGVVVETAAISLIRGIWVRLIAAAKQYEATVPAPVGALAEVYTAFTDLVANFQAWLTSLSLPNGALLTMIVGLAQIILSTIASLEGRLPPIAASDPLTASAHRRFVEALHRPLTVAGKFIGQVPAVDRSVGRYKKDWNKVAVAGGHPEAELPLSLLEHL
jgi:hypothetical protein